MSGTSLATILACLAVSAITTVAVNAALFHPGGAVSAPASSSEPESLLQGDVNCDGDVDLADALDTLKYVGELEGGGGDSCFEIGSVAAIAGPPGEPGPPGISGYEIVQVEQQVTGGNHPLTADCPDGKRVIGGGAGIVVGGDQPGDRVISSVPAFEGASWAGFFGIESAGTVRVTAICGFVEQ